MRMRFDFAVLASILTLTLNVWPKNSIFVNGNMYSGMCANDCSGHGRCKHDLTTAGMCECFPDWIGSDCSQRLCPAGKAWVDYPSADNTAHADLTECSNMGICSRETGVCACSSGFGGAACDQLLCPVGMWEGDADAYPTLGIPSKLLVCSGQGKCMSLRDASEYQDYNTYFGNNPYASDWDADMIFGCVCEEGWEGTACSKRSCPKGDDPTKSGNYDIQLIDCECGQCSGGIYLTLDNYQSPFIPYDANEDLIKYRLLQMPGVEGVTVKFLTEPQTATNDHPSQMCSETGTITQITFQVPSHPRSKMILTNAGGDKNSILKGSRIGVRANGERSVIDSQAHSQKGTREAVECSNHGRCSHISGTCQCYDGYQSSNGMGQAGNKGDCGYRYQNINTYTSYSYNISQGTRVTIETKIYSTCPFVDSALCSGNGICNELAGTCECNTGYSGPACLNLTCSSSNAWFGSDIGEHTKSVLCGGVGECNGDTGKCQDCGGNWQTFAGEACELLSCYTDPNGDVCGGNGACLTLRQLAGMSYNDQKMLRGVTYTTPWDADRVRGCACERAISVDNQYHFNFSSFDDYTFFNETLLEHTAFYSDPNRKKFFRGPYAKAATDFTGYNCQNALCPKGDNPLTYRINNTNEVQQLTCRADNGTWTLAFRENSTLPMSVNVTAFELKKYLDMVYTIGEVKVTMSQQAGTPQMQYSDYYNRSICSYQNNNSVLIEFLTEVGDLPLLVPDVTKIVNIIDSIDQYEGRFVMNITEYQKGNKEDLECSAMGTCIESTGICECFEPFKSGDNKGGYGQRGDCSHIYEVEI